MNCSLDCPIPGLLTSGRGGSFILLGFVLNAMRWPAYAGYIISGTTWLLTAVGTYSLRYRLRLDVAKAVSYVFAPFGPTLLAGIFHHSSITEDIIEGKDPECSVCLPTKAACINVLVGWLVPVGVSLGVAQHVARLTYSYPMPPLNEFRPLLKEMNKVTYKIRPVYGATLALSAIVPFVLTHLEKKTIDKEGSIPMQQYAEQLQQAADSSNSSKHWRDTDVSR